MIKFQRKSSINTQALKDQETKRLKSCILSMESDPQLYDTLSQDQIFGILCIILNKSSYHRTQSEIEILKKATRHIVYFQKLIEKDQGVLLWERCLRKMSYNYLSYGQTLFREGDVGTTFYIILQGRVSIHKRLLVQDEFQDKELIQLQDGQAFGELALENNEPRSASVKAILPTHLAVLEADDYMVIKKTFEINQQRQMYFEEFAKLTIFKDWKFMSVKSLFDVIKLNKYGLNHVVYREGDPSNDIYFIQTGEFKVLLIQSQVIKTLKMNKSNEDIETEDDLEFLKEQFAYTKPTISNQEKIDSLYQKKKYGNLIPSDKRLIMTLKFLGAGEMFGELEILKASDLCRQFSIVSTFETNTVYSIQKKDFLRVLQCDPPLNMSLNALNDNKLKQILTQIKVYERNFIDQPEKKNILERTQNLNYLNPKFFTESDQECHYISKASAQICKVSSQKKSFDKKIRELTLTLVAPNQDMNGSPILPKTAHEFKHSRQKTLEQIITKLQKNSSRANQKRISKKSPESALLQGMKLGFHNELTKRIPTQFSTTHRQQTSPTARLDTAATFSNARIYFQSSLPFVLQNNYFRLKQRL